MGNDELRVYAILLPQFLQLHKKPGHAQPLHDQLILISIRYCLESTKEFDAKAGEEAGRILLTFHTANTTNLTLRTLMIQQHDIVLSTYLQSLKESARLST
jgi:hypothetical protein